MLEAGNRAPNSGDCEQSSLKGSTAEGCKRVSRRPADAVFVASRVAQMKVAREYLEGQQTLFFNTIYIYFSLAREYLKGQQTLFFPPRERVT